MSQPNINPRGSTQIKAPLKIGWICLILGHVLFPLCWVPLLGIFLCAVALPFSIAALILGIVCIVRKRKVQGCIMMVFNPVIYIIVGILFN